MLKLDGHSRPLRHTGRSPDGYSPPWSSWMKTPGIAEGGLASIDLRTAVCPHVQQFVAYRHFHHSENQQGGVSIASHCFIE